MLTKMFDNPYDTKTPFSRSCHFWYRDLFNLAVSLFKYEGLPPSINEYYLKGTLLLNGYIIWSKDKKGNLRALNGGLEGIDCYNMPVHGIIANHTLGDWRTTFGVDSVLQWSNNTATPLKFVLSHYAELLADLDCDVAVNLENLKLTKVFHASTTEEKTKIENMLKKVRHGNSAIITNLPVTELFGTEKVPLFSTETEYIINKLLEDRRSIYNEFLTEFGINNCAIEKRERLILAEVDANNDELLIRRDFWLNAQRNGINAVNKIFGTEISVDMTTERGESNGTI